MNFVGRNRNLKKFWRIKKNRGRYIFLSFGEDILNFVGRNRDLKEFFRESRILRKELKKRYFEFCGKE